MLNKNKKCETNFGQTLDGHSVNVYSVAVPG